MGCAFPIAESWRRVGGDLGRCWFDFIYDSWLDGKRFCHEGLEEKLPLILKFSAGFGLLTL